MLEVEGSVNGDRMVTRAQHGPPVGHDPEQTAPERLVVVDDVVLAAPGGQGAANSPAEGPRLGKAGGAHHGELGDVDRGAELSRSGHAKRIRLPVEVEARDRDIPHPVVEHRPRLAGEDGYLMAEVHQRPGEVAGIDALTARIRVAAIDQEGDPERVVPGHKAQTVVCRELPVKLVGFRRLGGGHRPRPFSLPRVALSRLRS